MNENDERSIVIRKTAADYMWYITLFLLCGMSLMFVILNLQTAAWISLAVMLTHILVYFALLSKLNKKL